MEDKIEELLKQYPFQVLSRRRTRGAFLLETDQGLRILKECDSSLSRIEFEEKIKNQLIEGGYQFVDLTCKNSKDEYFTKDNYRNNWLVRQWFAGTECDIRDEGMVVRCVEHLGYLHGLLKLQVSEEERDKSCYVQKEGICQEMERHNRELKRVRSYIRSKKQKNEMEICLLNSFETFFGQAGLAQSILQESAYDSLWESSLKEGRVSHGGYNYHNILCGKSSLITTNFDEAEIGIQIRDFYDFLRKVMEKNSWNVSLGMGLLQAYRKKRELEPGEGEVLYALMLFPEKYWKLVNFYYNSRKSWLPAKNLEKLVRICGQEEARTRFLKILKNELNIH